MNNVLEQFIAITDKEISTRDLDSLITLYRDTRAEYDKQKILASELNKQVEDYESKILEYLQTAGKTKYITEGVGTISVVEKVYVTTPKTAEEKDAFFNFVEELYGKDGLDKYRTVNSQSLNSLFKLYREENPEATCLPGTGEMSVSQELRFTKSK